MTDEKTNNVSTFGAINKQKYTVIELIVTLIPLIVELSGKVTW